MATVVNTLMLDREVLIQRGSVRLGFPVANRAQGENAPFLRGLTEEVVLEV